jgi:chromate transporter
LKSVELALIGFAVLIFSLLSFNEIYLMFGAGFLALLLHSIRTRKSDTIKQIFPFTFLQLPGTTILAASNLNLFLIFLKIGAILYGSGYVLFAFLDTELVSTGILSRQQLIDAIAVGQFTPGPLFSSVTFIGYQINSFTGAVVSTIGIFLPSFVFVALLNSLVKKMRNSNQFSAFLDAVNVASVAIIISVCYAMGKETITDWRTVSIAIGSLLLIVGFKKINSALIVFGGSLAGYLLTFI